MAEATVKVSVPPEVAEDFKLLKQRRKYKFLVMRLTDSFAVEVVAKGEPTATVEDFVRALPLSEARYAVYDHEFTTRDGRKTDKIYFLTYNPGSATGKSKMFYSSQRRALDGIFTGVDDAQAASAAEIRRLFGATAAAKDEDDGDWDPDA